MADWMRGTRAEQLNQAKVWLTVIKDRGSGWGIPGEETDALKASVDAVEPVWAITQSADRSHKNAVECQRLFKALTAKMRYIKDRYFKQPPLTDEDFAALLLNAPKQTRTSRGNPKAQITAKIIRHGTEMLALEYCYAEGTETLADPHTDLRRQVRMGLLPPEGIAPEGTEMAHAPLRPEDLPEVIDTQRGIDYFTFKPGTSGYTAYFIMRLHNGKSGYGPWGPMIHAIVP